MHIQINPSPDGEDLVAVVDGMKVPIVTFSADHGDDGRTLVSLVVAADEVSVSRSPASDPASVTAPTTLAALQQVPKRGVWGDPNTPDPRADLPSWEPERLGAQVARNVQVQP